MEILPSELVSHARRILHWSVGSGRGSSKVGVAEAVGSTPDASKHAAQNVRRTIVGLASSNRRRFFASGFLI
jgi:predicted kinase